MDPTTTLLLELLKAGGFAFAAIILAIIHWFSLKTFREQLDKLGDKFDGLRVAMIEAKCKVPPGMAYCAAYNPVNTQRGSQS